MQAGSFAVSGLGLVHMTSLKQLVYIVKGSNSCFVLASV